MNLVCKTVSTLVKMQLVNHNWMQNTENLLKIKSLIEMRTKPFSNAVCITAQKISIDHIVAKVASDKNSYHWKCVFQQFVRILLSRNKQSFQKKSDCISESDEIAIIFRVEHVSYVHTSVFGLISSFY